MVGSPPGLREPRVFYKIFAESFKDQDHLDAIVSEAQVIVNDALKADAYAKGAA